MNKWTTTSGCTVHQTLKGRNNSYLVSDGDHHLLVDTGHRKSWNDLEQGLSQLINGELSYLFLTHIHYDHG
ncbi:MAG: MBL fold metallo-hydrolase [Euryarchaeota archaeon]|nr:MBL fold metallo-hydrolase [Euryarchaeota archaeon]